MFRWPAWYDGANAMRRPILTLPGWWFHAERGLETVLGVYASVRRIQRRVCYLVPWFVCLCEQINIMSNINEPFVNEGGRFEVVFTASASSHYQLQLTILGIRHHCHRL
jgi:hypothetical protein